MMAAPELLGAPTIGGWSARPGGGGGGGHRSQISLLSYPKYMKKKKTVKKGRFYARFGTKKAIFRIKLLNKIYSKDVV
jgi:hypothetical protein